MGISMYKCTGAAFFRNGSTAEVGFALFSREGANLQFVAETDNYFRIQQFVPIIDTQDLQIQPVDRDEQYTVGQAVPIPSRSSAFGFIVEDVAFYIDAYDTLKCENDAVFRLEIASIIGLDTDEIAPILDSAAGAAFSDSATRDRWLDIEKATRRASEVYWSSLDSGPVQELLAELEAMSIQDVQDALRWLRIERNFWDPSWIKVWVFARIQEPLSKELRDISAGWLNTIFSELSPQEALESQHFMTVLLFVCELSTTTREFDEIYDVVEELHGERSDIMQVLIQSRISHRNLGLMFEDHGNFAAMESADHWARLKGYLKDQRSTLGWPSA
ncbi:hypothetical protein HF251_31965 [Rhizobium leguminosarum]|uniref:hypothetical protein n=1 Tax=Rhizobium leguminosarum TaxID=384 RepID=UPI001C9098AD|nr:hypothetical protein [Rhizobium leguminosarum]MBY2925049.1 hypothetical protein [Rhizobium leguminosarum]MBY2967246.1 hypothetical protein [Rhizobium leguminosarum]